MTPNQIKILYGLNALFFCALVGMFVYLMPRFGQQQPQANQYPGGAPVDASTTAALANITVGNSANTPAAMIQGSITQINGGVLTVKDKASGQTYAVSTNAQTDIGLAGQQKDQTTYQKEMDAYYAEVKQLMQDPIKNKTALASLTIPTPVKLTPGTLADLAVGDAVEATAASAITGTSFTAIKIVKYPRVVQ